MPELKLEHSLVDNRYEVLDRLSRGSYAEIFVARDREADGKEVVIKALNTSLQGTPDAELERTLVENFQNEAIALDSVRHPHVILRWGHGTAADLRSVPFHYLVLEYMPGGDLLKLCRRRPGNALSLKEALFYFRQVCEALAYAHSRGVIHRDLKPNNFLLSADRQTLKIADFGVAKISTGEDSEITRVGADIYAPPEHHPDEDKPFSRLTAAADIYSLAKSFYTVVCGRGPSEFKCDPIAFLPPEMKKRSWAEPLLKVLKRATEDDPSARYESVIEFWSDLAQVASFDEDDSTEEETIVKPRLKVSPGTLPQSPQQPEFEPTLASSRPQKRLQGTLEVVAEAEPQIAAQMAEPLPRDNAGGRYSKLYIDLNNRKQQSPQQPGPNKAGDLAAKPKVADSLLENARARKQLEAGGSFNETLRRRIFLVLLGLALLGSLISMYNFVRNRGLALGFGAPSEIEIVTEAMNVRAAPNSDATLGVVLRGSRHRVLNQNERGWLNIEVGQWDESRYHSLDQNKGWVYGNPDYVRVVSRRLW